MPSGFSGASVFRCKTNRDQHDIALKCWPEGTTSSRIAEVHRVQKLVADNGCVYVPKLLRLSTQRSTQRSTQSTQQTWFTNRNRIWDACTWLPGEPLSFDADADSILKGARAIANFHRFSSVAGTSLSTEVPAINNRLRRAKELNTILPQVFSASVSAGSPLIRKSVNQAIDLLRLHWAIASAQIIRSMKRHAGIPLPIQYVLRDVHREHILFHDNEPAGLIDFDALRVDTLATDYVRWVGSFALGKGRTEIWRQIASDFFSDSPFRNSGDDAHFLLLDLHYGTTWISIGNWAVWLALERRNFSLGDEIIAARIDRLCQTAVASL